MICHVVLLVVQLSITFAEYAPVFMWSKVKLPDPAPALYKRAEESFKNLLYQYVKENQVIVFVEAYLSPEDFIQGEKVFVDMYTLKKENNIIYLPSVENPVNSIQQLGKEVKKEIFITEFDNAQNGELRRQMLKRHSSDIFASCTAREDEYVAIYTSLHSSWPPPSHRNRHLLQFNSTNETYIIFSGDQILLCLTSFGTYLHTNQSDKSMNKINITKTFKLTSTVNLNNTNMLATLKSEALEINFIIIKKSGYWYINSMYVKENDQHEIYLQGTEDFYAPNSFSFHCASFNLTNEDHDVVLTLPGFQIQPFLQEKVFGEAYDCIGFITIGIASGVFTCGLLLGILFIGVSVLWNIKTMDRFDDPKGKTITVVTSD